MNNNMSNTRSANGHSKGFVEELNNAVRENPVSAALVGMGVLWLLFGGSKITTAAAMLPQAAKGAASVAGDGIATAVTRVGEIGRMVGDKVQEAVSGATSSAGDALSATADAASGAARRAAEKVSQMGSMAAPAAGENSALGIARTLQKNLTHAFERQPLLLGAIGLAVGAGMAAALPGTDVEKEFAGDAADKVKEQAQQFADQQIENLSATAQRAYAEVKNEALAQGLTPAAAKEALSGIGEKLRSVARTTQENLTNKVS